MALKLTARLALLAVALGAATGGARAQALQRLTVESFVLETDASRPQIDTPFHLIVVLKVRERVSEIDNLELPMLAQLELLGDERQTVSGTRGTQYRETITVVAHAGGSIAIAPATLQALDARDNKPKQWYTNGLSLYAGASPTQVIRNGGLALFGTLLILVRILLVLLAAAAAIFLALRVVRRRPRPPVPVVLAQPTPVALVRSRRQQVEDALTVLSAERTRAAAARVRAAIWRTIGASEGETLGDVLRRPGSGEVPLRDVLIALERSAFTYDEDLSAAIADACAALERYAGSLP
jgi:hypothetical protein